MIIWKKKSSFSANGGDCVEVGWRRSSFSGNGGTCVEVSWPDLAVAVRDSKNTDGPTIEIAPITWHAFLASVRH